jgi:ribose/xylose/arabinose/galactoside ABC-type transport system permease subunit
MIYFSELMLKKSFLYLIGVFLILMGATCYYVSDYSQLKPVVIMISVLFIAEGALYLTMPRKVIEVLSWWKTQSLSAFRAYSIIPITISIFLFLAAKPESWT